MITLPKPPHPSRASSGCGVEEEVDCGDFALADDDEIDTGIDRLPLRYGIQVFYKHWGNGRFQPWLRSWPRRSSK
jgi:hypothetical protein